MLDMMFDWLTAAFGERWARATRPWVYGLGLILLIILVAVMLRLVLS